MTNYQTLTAPGSLEGTKRNIMRKNSSNMFLAAVAVTSGLAFTTMARADMGRTEGSWGVSPSGAATYSIPLWVQPGPKGLQPSLAFVYNSQGGNGTMGIGWALAGFSSIDRCPSTVLEDGADKPVYLNSSDRFCMGGNKLRITSGPLSSYGTANAVYQTAIDEFTRVTSVGTAGSGPQSWLAHTKSGLILEFGNTADSRVVLRDTTVYQWMLNKVSDRDGNSYVVTYVPDNTTGRVPLTVSWGPTAANGANYQYQAAFNYSVKTAAGDWVSARQGLTTPVQSVDVVNKQRLDSVTIGYSASGASHATKRQYVLAYDSSPMTGRSRLTSITECAATTANCLKPTTIAYQNGSQGVSNTPTAVPSIGAANVGKFDFNGDGRNDLAYRSGTWKVALSTGAGFTAPIETGVAASTPQVGHYVSARVDGFLHGVSGVWNYTSYNGSTFTTTSTGVAILGGNLSAATDANGDGLVDIIHSSTSLVGSTWNASVYVRLNNTTGTATVPSFSSSVYTAFTTPVGPANGAINFLSFDDCPSERQCDINGDGIPDLNVLVTTTFGCGPSGCSASTSGYDMVSASGNYTLANSRFSANDPYIGIRFNSDRCIDSIRFNTTSLRVNSCGTGVTTIVPLPAPYLTFLDWDGDGKSDEIINNGGTIGVYKSTGSISAPFQPLITTSIPYDSACRYFPVDVEGDGLDELACVTSTSTKYYSHSGGGSVGSPGGNSVFVTQVPDLLSSVTDGYGLSVSPSYISTAQSNYTVGDGTTLPLVDATDVIHAVGRLRISDGLGSTYDLDYTYKGARRNSVRGPMIDTVGDDQSATGSRTTGVEGEWAGFEEITIVDSRNGIKQKTTYEQLFPLVGMVKKSEMLQSDSTPILIVTNTNLAEALDPTAGNKRYFTYLSQSLSDSYEVGGSLNGQLITSSTKTIGYTSFTYGNYTTYTTVVTDKDSTTTPSQFNSTWTTAVTNTYEPSLTSGSDWCVGFVNQTQIAHSSTVPGVNPVTRTISFAPDTSNPSKCRIKTKIIEPSSAQYRVTQTNGFDAFGNVNSVQVVGRQPLAGGGYGDMPPRTTSTDWGATGQFPVSSTDPSGAASTFAYNSDDGTLKNAYDPSSTGSNVIKSSFLYDGFARPTRATRPDGTYTTLSYEDCATVACVYPAHKMTVKETDFDVMDGLITDRYTYRDAFDRTFVTRARLLDGATWNGSYQWNETQYDALGRVYKRYMPCMTASASSSCRLHAVTSSYDVLNRLTQSSRPRSQSDSSSQVSSYAYAGRAQTTTDPLGKISVRVLNVAGLDRQIKDANNYALNFDYDAAGSLVGTNDSGGAARLSGVTIQYGIRAFPVAATDSATGQQTRTFNSLGDLVAWTNAKGQNFSATYDALSRPLTRVEPNASTSWEWGNNSAEFNRGKLRHVESTENGETYAEHYTYDSLTRLLTKSVSIPGQGTFNYDYGYSANKGWLDTLTYPVSTPGYRFALKYTYQNGALQSVADANAPATVFWTANSNNAWGQTTQETFGNNIVRASTFDAVTARLSSMQAGTSGNPTSVQNLSYLYDLVGNVSQRQNNKLGLTETFYYGSGSDNLYRLEHSTLNNGSTTVTNLALTYDASGNILTKNEAGLSEPLLNQTVTWTSYDYPAQIAAGGESISLAYGPHRQRWRMIYNSGGGTETTYYIGGMLEQVVTGAGTKFRHTINSGGAAVAIYSRSSSGSAALIYTLSDHQGSTESFVDGATTNVTNSSFSAFGMRRNAATWSGDATNRAALDDISRQGYTYQTVLGSMGLNHMNGRVQDAANGRFLSADPFIAEPGNTQNYNRYSYVYNNPLTFTDPSGFCSGLASGSRLNGTNDVESSPSKEECERIRQEIDAARDGVTVTGRRSIVNEDLRSADPNANPSGIPNDALREGVSPNQPGPQGEPLETITVTGRIKLDPCKSETGAPLKASDSSIIVRNDRNESVTVRLGNHTRQVGPYRAIGPYVSPSNPLNIEVSAPSNNNFGTQLQLNPGWQLDMVILDSTGQVYNGAMADFAKDKNLLWPRSYNEYFNLAVYDMREINGDVGLDLGLMDLKLFDFSVPRTCSR